MSWLTILWRAVELIAALLQKLRPAPASEPAQPKPHITKASVDEQIARQRELYRKNHPNGGGMGPY